MNLLVITDRNYLCYLHCLWESWASSISTSSKITWHVYYIISNQSQTADSQEILDELQHVYHHRDLIMSRHRNVTININTLKAPLYADDAIIPIGVNHNGRRTLTRFMAYCANIRARLIRDVLIQIYDGDVLVYMDVDSLIRGDISAMSRMVKNHDIMVYFCNETYKRATSNHPQRDSARETYIKSGLLGFHKNLACLQFAEKYHEMVDKMGFTTWGADQSCLIRLIDSDICQNRLNIGFWKQIFIDWHFKKDSIIWMGKGVRKDSDKIYLREYEFYRKQWKKKFKNVNKTLTIS